MEVLLSVIGYVQKTFRTASEFLDSLARRLRRDWPTTGTRKENQLAALEILVQFEHADAEALLSEGLVVRPVSESHLYLVSLARGLIVISPDRRKALAGNVVDVLNAALTTDGSVELELRRRLSVEAFRTLSKLAPEEATGTVCSLLPGITGLEQTAVWDAVAAAAAALGPQVLKRRELKAAARDRWSGLIGYRYPDDIDNFAGIAARVLEVLCRTGESLDVALVSLGRLGTLRTWVLQQFARRPLDFLDEATRSTAYVEALKALLDASQMQTFSEIVSRIAREYPRELQNVLQKVLAP